MISLICNQNYLRSMGNRIYYYCPQCGSQVWAYGGFEGNTCWGCKGSKPFTNKGSWYNLMNKQAIKLGTDLTLFYEGNNKVKVKGIIFENVLPKFRWQKRTAYSQVSDTYVCGLNAINLALAIWGYGKQIKQSEYSYMYFGSQKWGMSGSSFYKYNVEPVFKYCGYTYESRTFAGRVSFKWDYIDDTDYQNYCLIALGGYGLGAHYFMVIGVSKDKNHYLITDQTKMAWVIDTKLMRTACLYSNNGYTQHSLYRVG